MFSCALQNLCVSIFLNIHVWKHVDPKISSTETRKISVSQYMTIKVFLKNLKYLFQNAIEVKKLNLWRKKTKACHYICWTLIFCKKNLKIQSIC